MPLTAAQERLILQALPTPESLPNAGAVGVALGGPSGFVSVIRRTVTADPSDNTPLHVFSAPFDKNFEDATGMRVRQLAFLYGIWLIQNERRILVGFEFNSAQADVPPALTTDKAPKFLGLDLDPSGVGWRLYGPDWPSIGVGGFLPTTLLADQLPVAGDDCATTTGTEGKFCRLRNWGKQAGQNLRNAGRWLLRNAKLIGGLVVGAIILGFIGIGLWMVVAFFEGLGKALGNQCEITLLSKKEIPDCTVVTCQNGQKGIPGAGAIEHWKFGDCSTKLLNTCCGDITDVGEPGTALGDYLLWGAVAIGALIVIYFVARGLSDRGGRGGGGGGERSIPRPPRAATNPYRGRYRR